MTDACRKVLVTGSTGNVGREVVRALARSGLGVRAADRHPHRVHAVFGPIAEPVHLDFHDPTTFTAAVEGCDGLFLLRPPAITKVRATLNRLIDIACDRGVRHIVFLSVAGAAKNVLVPHHAVEAHLMNGTSGWTILRPGFFAQNLGDAYRADILLDRRIYVPAGSGRAAFVDVRDVAEVTARVFLAPSRHAHEAYTLTGPEAVSFADAARFLSEVIGVTIRYEPATLRGYIRHLRARGLPLGQVLVQTVLHFGLRFGQAARVDPTLERLLERPGHSLRDYVRAHASTWRDVRQGDRRGQDGEDDSGASPGSASAATPSGSRW